MTAEFTVKPPCVVDWRTGDVLRSATADDLRRAKKAGFADIFEDSEDRTVYLGVLVEDVVFAFDHRDPMWLSSDTEVSA